MVNNIADLNHIEPLTLRVNDLSPNPSLNPNLNQHRTPCLTLTDTGTLA